MDLKNQDYNFRNIIVKICDIKYDQEQFSNKEILERCKMASLCRIMDIYSWSLSTKDTFSYRFNENEILINPQGLMSYEITASSLIKIDTSGNVINKNSLNFTFNKQAFHFHSLIYQSFSQHMFIIQITNPVLISIFTDPKLIDALYKDNEIQNEILIYKTIHDSYDSNDDEDFVKRIEQNRILFIYGKDLLLIGSSIEDAYNLIYKIMFCCKIQIHHDHFNNVTFPNLFPNLAPFGNGVCASLFPLLRKSYQLLDSSEHVEFDAHLRLLDRLGFHTGLCQEYMLIDNESIYSEDKSPYQSTYNDYSSYRTKELNSDSGVATITTSDEKGSQSIDYNDLNMDVKYIPEEIPHSESSKELLICMSYFGHDDKDERSKTPNSCNLTKMDSPTHKRFKTLTKNAELLRRSKSLTSGVEKAIFRRINEKCMYDQQD